MSELDDYWAVVVNEETILRKFDEKEDAEEWAENELRDGLDYEIIGVSSNIRKWGGMLGW